MYCLCTCARCNQTKTRQEGRKNKVSWIQWTAKGIFKVKYDKDGRVERFKGYLVAKGYAQKHGIDYEETFSPVVCFSSIRTLLTFAVQHNLLIHQMDVVLAFLNGKLQEDIYMQQPEGYVQAGNEQLVCKLKKSLYGLK